MPANSILVTGDTRANGVDAGEDFAEEGTATETFTDTVDGTIISLAPLAVVNGGDSTIAGSAESVVDATVTSTAGAATADVVVGNPTLVQAATRGAEVELSCDAVRAESEVFLLTIGGTPVDFPGTEPFDVIEGLLVIEGNKTVFDVFDDSDTDGDLCGLTVQQTALHVQVLPPAVLLLLDLKFTGAEATLDNIPCSCAVLGLPTPTPTATGTVT
ncbi:MAG: hypothetical protein ACREQJ_13345, partial [Candidatus Binatia bacterium]